MCWLCDSAVSLFFRFFSDWKIIVVIFFPSKTTINREPHKRESKGRMCCAVQIVRCLTACMHELDLTQKPAPHTQPNMPSLMKVSAQRYRLFFSFPLFFFCCGTSKPRPSSPHHPTNVISLPSLMHDLLEVLMCVSVFIYGSKASWDRVVPSLLHLRG